MRIPAHREHRFRPIVSIIPDSNQCLSVWQRRVLNQTGPTMLSKSFDEVVQVIKNFDPNVWDSSDPESEVFIMRNEYVAR